ncbi:hypothetical protein [Prescottella agglutinans]|uniref:Uncharacterized protein n=1 Tax=Prescottella agglutinans TaxID=1644129 RepID=A0ABT6MEX8_9NOCA|nr:hypothetical protein [Prescottella agglutinans]MDH6282867.1 hypothetical protein [Prescottella agglutinans]
MTGSIELEDIATAAAKLVIEQVNHPFNRLNPERAGSLRIESAAIGPEPLPGVLSVSFPIADDDMLGSLDSFAGMHLTPASMALVEGLHRKAREACADTVWCSPMFRSVDLDAEDAACAGFGDVDLLVERGRDKVSGGPVITISINFDTKPPEGSV